MREAIKRILAAHGKMEVDSTGIADDADLYALGLTSHASVNVMLALEDEFDIEFPDQALKRSTFATVKNIEVVVSSLAE
ncbi:MULTISPECIES: acyl carrier protein [unclassified Mycolicibacterium]|uniref:acyl carrier protein n=1 Tax=unclassified Mycolicibacterium TaxID=2636767 RepID=UPI00192E54E6|nr:MULTISPECIES: acyl carrier protein [unclassified Mycolicibacterium]